VVAAGVVELGVRVKYQNAAPAPSRRRRVFIARIS
jgi:hypothetical protein